MVRSYRRMLSTPNILRNVHANAFPTDILYLILIIQVPISLVLSITHNLLAED